MVRARTTSGADIADGDPTFLTPATIRQPADGLGARAQRTIERIIESAREVFMTRGYSGTTIDEIARVAGVSRASVYTYFPSKREVLLAVGAHAASSASEIISTLADREPCAEAMNEFVNEYFQLLDVHGSFSFAWTQAAQGDEEIRIAGMKRHLGICKAFGNQLGGLCDRPVEDPAALGLVAASLLERTWSYLQLYASQVDRAAVIGEAARSLLAIARAVD
jgi:AcrR family transcriptional regulator